MCGTGIDEQCSFCDILIRILDSDKFSCGVFESVREILRRNKEEILKRLHYNVQTLKYLLEEQILQKTSQVSCIICTDVFFEVHEDYIAHLNKHYLDSGSFFKKYFVKEPPVSEENLILCPTCSEGLVIVPQIEPTDIRSWVSDHFYKCGELIRREKIESKNKFWPSAQVFKCGWCESSFNRGFTLKTHMESCCQKGRHENVKSEDDKEIFTKILYNSEDCLECIDYDRRVLKNDETETRQELVKHVYDKHPFRLDSLDLSDDNLIYLSKFLSGNEAIVELISGNCCLCGETNHTGECPVFSVVPYSDYPCVICTRGNLIWFPSETALKLHYIRVHFRDRVVPEYQKQNASSCLRPECGIEFNNFAEASEHYGIFHSNLSKVMSKSTNQHVIFESQRFSTDSGGKNKTWTCPFCPKTFKSSLNRVAHVGSHLKSEILNQFPMAEKFVCSYQKTIDEKECGNESRDEDHHIIHASICHDAVDKLLSEKGLDIDSHHESDQRKNPTKKKDNNANGRRKLDPNSFFCNQCKENFASKENRKLHTCHSIFDKTYLSKTVCLEGRNKRKNINLYPYLADTPNESSHIEVIDLSNEDTRGATVKKPKDLSDYQCSEKACKLFFPNAESLYRHVSNHNHT